MPFSSDAFLILSSARTWREGVYDCKGFSHMSGRRTLQISSLYAKELEMQDCSQATVLCLLTDAPGSKALTFAENQREAFFPSSMQQDMGDDFEGDDAKRC